MREPFADVIAANAEYARAFPLRGLPSRPAKRLVVLTCMDTRIDPLAMLGLSPGDAKILRNAGARVNDDVLAGLVVARYLLGVERAMVVGHTDCRMGAASADELHDAIAAAGGPDTRGLSFAVGAGRAQMVRDDVQRIRSSPYLDGLEAEGFVYDVETGLLGRV